MKCLVVRLGSLGDIIHTLPAVAALRAAFPDAIIDWVVERLARALADRIPILDAVHEIDTFRWRRAPLSRLTRREAAGVFRELRARRYDVALDFQGLVKSAVVARASGADRVLGFARRALREPAARAFYHEGVAPGPETEHVIEKNRALARRLGVRGGEVVFPLREDPADAAGAETVVRQARFEPAARFVILNPGGGWPTKRWPAARFGELARELQVRNGLRALVAWGPGEEPLARAVVDASGGAATAGAPMDVPVLLAVLRRAALFVGGDTGPLHFAAAVGTPIVGLFGPTDPRRNGPWRPEDRVVSRYGRCACPYGRTCMQPALCIDDITVSEVLDAAQSRLAV